MKLREIFRFELAYQLRRPWPWLLFAALLGFALLFARDGSLGAVLYEDFFINSPFPIAAACVFGTLMWLLAAPVIAGEAGARDVATGMHPLTYTAPIGKADYLLGRFLAAFLINAVILLAVPLGHLLAVYTPGVHPASIGPFRPMAYLGAYGIIALPNAFAATALQFALSVRSGRVMAAYLASVFFFFMAIFVGSLLLYRRGVGTLLDPTGIRYVIEDLAHLWTTSERRWRLLALEGPVLRNRILWSGIGLAALAMTYLQFRFAHRADTGWLPRWLRPRAARAPVGARLGVVTGERVQVRAAPRSFAGAIHLRQMLAIGWSSFRMLASSWAGLALLVAIPLMTVPIVLDQLVSAGTPLVPVTGQVLKQLTGPLSSEMSRWVIIPLMTVFFAGELVWRERDAGLGEISDAAPVPEWVPLLGKFLGLALMLAAVLAGLMAAGMAAQLLEGYHDFELGLYLKVLFGFQLPEYLLFAALALVVHVVVDQKYAGHMVAVTAFVFIALASMFGIEHDLLIFGAGPWWSYTEMRGLGPYLWPWLWFKLYWAAWALLLGVVARLFWVRGRERGLRLRLRLARQRLSRGALGTGASAIALILGLGGFIFHNTNVLNEYLTPERFAGMQAEYERRYSRYAGVPQPTLTAATLRVDIHPRQRAAEFRGTYRLVNRTGVAIDTIHVATPRRGSTRSISFDRPATAVLVDDRLGHRVFRLRQPLQPGDSLRLDFRVRDAARGFREGGADVSVVENGTILGNVSLPQIGYQHRRELLGPAERREHGLRARPVIPSLYDREARKGRGSGITLDAVVSTDGDQVAVAPGALRRTWREGGRRFFHYVTDGPIGGEWVFTSARYAVREARWRAPSGQPVDIRIYHHPTHTRHLDRTVRSIQASLDHYTRVIGPYRYRHITVVEVPGDGVGMHADASMLSHGEGITLLAPDDPRAFDLPFAVGAHEMAHQWAVPAAFVEGAPVLSESLAWYYALQVVDRTLGRDQQRRALRNMRLPYPHAPIRRGEPLLRGLDPYMSYRRGPFALFALGEYMGHDRVNGALRRFYEKHRPDGAPVATTLDLYAELQAVTPDSLRYLLHDLFEVNTYWQLDAESVRADSLPGGQWRVTLDVRARKVAYDTAGVETRVPMDEWVPIGVFGERQPGRSALSSPLYLRMHRIRSGEQTITVIVPGRPVIAGIDPFHVLDWEQQEEDDNLDEL